MTSIPYLWNTDYLIPFHSSCSLLILSSTCSNLLFYLLIYGSIFPFKNAIWLFLKLIFLFNTVLFFQWVLLLPELSLRPSNMYISESFLSFHLFQVPRYLFTLMLYLLTLLPGSLFFTWLGFFILSSSLAGIVFASGNRRVLVCVCILAALLCIFLLQTKTQLL